MAIDLSSLFKFLIIKYKIKFWNILLCSLQKQRVLGEQASRQDRRSGYTRIIGVDAGEKSVKSQER